LKIKMFVLVSLLCWVPLHATPQDSYYLLESLAHLEQKIIAFSRYASLSHHFEFHPRYQQHMREQMDAYDRTMRQMTVDLEGSDNRKLLNQFVAVKSSMHDVLSGDHFSEDFQRLMSSSHHLETTIAQVATPRIAALSPEQRVLYALMQMQVLVEKIARDYVVEDLSGAQTKHISDALARDIREYEAQDRVRKAYTQWSTREQITGDRIASAWAVMKASITQPHLPMLIDLGADHIDGILAALRAMITEGQ